ncbi:MAG: enoyl-CoA hydratase [Hyphomicrobiales bacterium]|nr:enoyl-CoA hydratase [Hyphomicrobiales bacterium]
MHAPIPTGAEPPVSLEEADGVALVTLRSPATRNALSSGMMAALSDALGAVAGDPALRAVVIAGEGPAFSAGHDLKEIAAARAARDGGRAAYEAIFGRCDALMAKLHAMPQPTIAAVEGVATAAGLQLMATCDLAVAGADATFCTPGVDVGLFCSTPGAALSRVVGRRQALEMLFTGDVFDAREALRMGLVNRVVETGGALAEARKIAARIAAKSARTVAFGKETFRAQEALPRAEAMKLVARAMVDNLMTADAAEGVDAFLARRRPVWRDE